MCVYIYRNIERTQYIYIYIYTCTCIIYKLFHIKSMSLGRTYPCSPFTLLNWVVRSGDSDVVHRWWTKKGSWRYGADWGWEEGTVRVPWKCGHIHSVVDVPMIIGSLENQLEKHKCLLVSPGRISSHENKNHPFWCASRADFRLLSGFTIKFLANHTNPVVTSKVIVKK